MIIGLIAASRGIQEAHFVLFGTHQREETHKQVNYIWLQLRPIHIPNTTVEYGNKQYWGRKDGRNNSSVVRNKLDLCYRIDSEASWIASHVLTDNLTSQLRMLSLLHIGGYYLNELIAFLA
ncbi:unnamed protein product [Heterobilharzia americana]|nr:unnamed protein product [Heterobilharzia americana]CAH8654051.1 unnamed protein product [Heterobilharzia americana]